MLPRPSCPAQISEDLICIKVARAVRGYAVSEMKDKVVKLDVREDLRRGREPFSKIMMTVAQLKDDESLLLIVPFEPAPLFAVLARQGFSHVSKPAGSGDWEVLFTRTPQRAPKAGKVSVVEVDARGLEPPGPMVTILEALATLPESAEMSARTDRRPMHLYAPVAERGFVCESEEQSDGSFITHIRRQ
jgi:uncharacterized protein (DUF2249 family)